MVIAINNERIGQKQANYKLQKLQSHQFSSSFSSFFFIAEENCEVFSSLNPRREFDEQQGK
jgi:hypothetical protein